MTPRDGHVRVLPLHVANKIAAGEVVERPASVIKELVENAVDAGATRIDVRITQGGRKLVAVQDDGCGMTRDDAVLAFERQATSKILDVEDIEEIDTLGFRGEAIPSIASVSRFSLTTRRRDADEGTQICVNAGVLAEVRSAGCPPGTLVEVRDLFCNVPARRKFLRAYATEENHAKHCFTVHALARPDIGFSMSVDGRELYRLAPSPSLADRIRDLFGSEFLADMLDLGSASNPTATNDRSPGVTVRGYLERPNLATPTRRDQYVFINGRPATAPSIAYALREAYPRRQGDMRPAAILFIDLPPNQIDVNVHPTKREVRFRDNVAVKRAILDAVERALGVGAASVPTGIAKPTGATNRCDQQSPLAASPDEPPSASPRASDPCRSPVRSPDPTPTQSLNPGPRTTTPFTPLPRAQPTETTLPLVAAGGGNAKTWAWFKYLATTDSGYLLLETDAGLVTVNPIAARERIAFERLMHAAPLTQALLIPDVVKMSPPDFARVNASLVTIRAMGFRLEEFGRDTWKIDAVPQLLGDLPTATVLATIAHDLADGSGRRGGDRWREELVARAIARSFAGAPIRLTPEGATKLVEELAASRMPYVCPRGKPIMIFTSNRELNRKFARE